VLEHFDGARVLNAIGDGALAHEALAQLLAHADLGVEDLDRGLVSGRIGGSIHGSHAAHAEHALQRPALAHSLPDALRDELFHLQPAKARIIAGSASADNTWFVRWNVAFFY
jgi:hypothetical protein